ncbi:site-specific integrase [Jatrophihabitans sp.]|uniref:tyrosine-type recombinase/integrase n=1 Tax=Jatrophihabitans sp. TaxID=1932789 RepID=UPI0030C738A0|nr:integrase [Jatrophihabitans sp.]
MTKRANGEGGIYQRESDGRWCAAVVHDDPVTGRRKRTVLYGKTRTEVKAKLKAATERIEDGGPVKDATSTVAAWVEQWRKTTLEASSRKQSTKTLYSTLARKQLEPEPFSALRLDKLRPTDIETLILTMRNDRKLADSTIRCTYTVLRSALDAAVRDGLLAKNPAIVVPRPGVARTEAHYLSPADVAVLLDKAKTSRFWAPLALIAGTGLRRGEALALRWDDVDLEAGTLRVRGTLARINGELVVTETNTQRSRRSIRLSPALVKLLTAHRKTQIGERLRAANQWTEGNFIFTTEAGQPMDPRNLLRALGSAADKAKFSGVSVHTLRHSAASALLEVGIGLKTVSEMLGHSSVSITGDIYQHVSDNAAQEAANALSKAMGL